MRLGFDHADVSAVRPIAAAMVVAEPAIIENCFEFFDAGRPSQGNNCSANRGSRAADHRFRGRGGGASLIRRYVAASSIVGALAIAGSAFALGEDAGLSARSAMMRVMLSGITFAPVLPTRSTYYSSAHARPRSAVAGTYPAEPATHVVCRPELASQGVCATVIPSNDQIHDQHPGGRWFPGVAGACRRGIHQELVRGAACTREGAGL